MDVSGENVPGLTPTPCASRSVTWGHIVNVAGPELSDINAVATLMGQRSTRQALTIADMWETRLTNEELSLMKDFGYKRPISKTWWDYTRPKRNVRSFVGSRRSAKLKAEGSRRESDV